jgi:hypothetical protein
MKIPALLFGVFIIAFSGCKKPAEKSTDGAITTSSVPDNKCPEFYYYYGKDKMPLTIAPNLLGIGFKEQLTVSQKLAVLRRFQAFEGFLNGNDSTTAFNIIEFQKGTTCPQALETIKKLNTLEEIVFANPVFLAPGPVGSGHKWAAINSNFLVTLKNPQQKAEFQKLLTLTNTRQVDDLGNGTYLVEATKNSKGNALEMANYFHEQAEVQTAEPDFFMTGQPQY